jgi:hypothetical protein
MYPGRIQWAEVVEAAREMVATYDGGVTLRQVFYRLAVAGIIPNTAAAYRKLSAHLAQARRHAEFPDLIDAVREIHVPISYADPGELLTDLPALYRRDRTEYQAAALYLAAEKDTLRALLADWAGEYGVPVLVLRGFSSETYVRRVRERVSADPRPAVLAYVGDHDASGEAILADWMARTGHCWASVDQIALTRDQVFAYGLPAAPGKASDPRWPAFAAIGSFGCSKVRRRCACAGANCPVQVRTLSVMRNRPRVMRARAASCSARSRRCSDRRAPKVKPSWAAMNPWAAMAMMTGASGR